MSISIEFLFRKQIYFSGCELSCHAECLEKVNTSCRSSTKDRNRSTLSNQNIVRVCDSEISSNLQKSTILSQIPKFGGIRKGWNKCQLLFHHTKILFYEFPYDKDKPPQPFLIIDLTDEYFHICSITQQDAIHAKKDDISSIFKVSNSLLRLIDELLFRLV